MNRLANKTGLITGGGSGIGLEVAKLFLGEGARVAITGRNKERLQKAAAELQGGDRLWFHPADLSKPSDVESLIQETQRRWGAIDILVNNAGLNIKERTIRELNPARWRTLLEANLDSAYYCTYAVLPEMLKRKEGLIVYISSIAGKRAGPLGGAAYASSKFGMRALGMCLAAEEKDSGIRVSIIYPGEVNTPILEARPNPLTEEQRKQILQPVDVAQSVLFVSTLPPHVSIPELVIKPTFQMYV